MFDCIGYKVKAVLYKYEIYDHKDKDLDIYILEVN